MRAKRRAVKLSRGTYILLQRIRELEGRSMDEIILEALREYTRM